MYYGEKLNSISHLVGAGLAMVGLGALITVGIQSGDPWVLFSFSVFGMTMVLAYRYLSIRPKKFRRYR